MALEIRKPWQTLDASSVQRVPGQLGVYEVGDAAGLVLYIGFAGARSAFGLRTELARHVGAPGAASFRYEVNTAYITRHRELLMVYAAGHDGRLPEFNRAEPRVPLGRLSPG